MALAKKRLKNVRKTGIKLSKKSALKFKRSASKVPTINMENVEDCPEIMEIDNEIQIKKKLTKKKLIRQIRKDNLRQCFEQKKLMSKKLVAHDAMEGAAPVEEAEQSSVVQQKSNSNRLRKDTLPVMPLHKNYQKKIREKELSAGKNVVTGRRMSKKKARKILNAMGRDARAAERKKCAMDLE